MKNPPLLLSGIAIHRHRFWARVDKRAPDECWNWTAAISKNGYGSFSLNGGRVTSSRMAYALAYMAEPGENMVLHTCDNRRCCNPAHLYLGDVRQNSRDMVERGRSRNGCQIGSQNGASKLTEAAVSDIKGQIAAGRNNKQIAADFGVTHQMVSKIRCGHFWKHVEVSGAYLGKNKSGVESSGERLLESTPDQEVKWSERRNSNPRPLSPQESDNS